MADKQSEKAKTAAPKPETEKIAASDTAKTPESVARGAGSRFHRLTAWPKQHKRLSALLIAVIFLAVIFGIPASRYAVLSLVKKQTVQVMVRDSQTDKPITEAEVRLGNHSAKTDKEGKVSLAHVKLGKATLQISKKYYRDAHANITVGLSAPAPFRLVLTATGRQVPLIIRNKISGAVIENALVKADGSSARSDKDGKVVLVLPANKDTVEATVQLAGYNDSKVTIKVSEVELPQNDISLTPAGKIYFLSKLSGTIDVVKTNLDGSDRQTVLAGTGKEDDSGTVLLASRDWKYLALQSTRDSDSPKLYLIDTATDKLTTIDEGDNVTFTITGWLDHDFIYSVDHPDASIWQPNKQSIKSFNAETSRLTVLDQTDAEGTSSYDYAYETYGQIYALKGVVLFTKNWYSATPYNFFGATTPRLQGKQAVIMSVEGDGSNKNTIKAISNPDDQPANTSVTWQSRAYDAGGVYFLSSVDDSVYKYEDSKINLTTDLVSTDFYTKTYPTFLQSPSGKQTFWSESRDGKNSLFIGDDDGENGHQIADLSDYTQYGWYSDDYVLVSKDSSELYILAKDGKHDAVKITDYHKPQFNYVGYGGGYGGI